MLSTHIMQEVEAVCNRVIIINNGQIVANDTTSVLQNSQAKNKQFITVEFDKEITPEGLKRVAGIHAVLHIKGTTWQIEVHSDEDIRPAIFQFAVQNSLAILTLHREEQRLEDVFKHLTK